MFDKSVFVKQLNVVEAHGILLLRADKGKLKTNVHTSLQELFQESWF